MSAPRTLVRLGWRVAALAVVLSFLVGWRLDRTVGADRSAAAHPMSMPGMDMPGMDMSAMPGMQDDPGFSPVHWLRYSTLAVPFAIVALLAVSLLVRLAARRRAADSTVTRLLFAVGVAVAALSAVASDAVSGVLFDEPLVDVAAGRHYLEVALVAVRYAFALGLVSAAFFGVPWAERRSGRSASSASTESTPPLLKDSR
ncbi:MAG TPA: hypothetical protein VFI00_02815 [Kribbella sp.]|nr:hypothetical protein [Kribbella sp.]